MYPVRIGNRALAVLKKSSLIRYWIGNHADDDRLF